MVLACVMATNVGTAVAQLRDSQTGFERPLQEVTVTAERLHDHRERVRAVSGFVDSHSARDFIAREILEVARVAGAPSGLAGRKCVTVEIVFTREPQALLDHIAKSYRPLLGFDPASQTQKQ